MAYNYDSIEVKDSRWEADSYDVVFHTAPNQSNSVTLTLSDMTSLYNVLTEWMEK